MLLAFNKPFGVLSQFTPDGSGNRPLAEFGFPKGVYPLGRLDADSEGLLLLSDEPGLNTKLLDPTRAHIRIYWVQVERVPGAVAISKLESGVTIQGFRTRPCRVQILDPQPEVPAREPPIRFRKRVEETWVQIELQEGKNRQVRRMTAAVGHPTLRLIRKAIGKYWLPETLPAGEWKELGAEERRLVFS